MSADRTGLSIFNRLWPYVVEDADFVYLNAQIIAELQSLAMVRGSGRSSNTLVICDVLTQSPVVVSDRRGLSNGHVS